MGGRAGLLFVPFRATDPLHLGPCLIISQQDCGALPALSQGQSSLPSSPDLVGVEDLPISPERFSEPFPSAHYTAKSLGLEEHMQFAR